MGQMRFFAPPAERAPKEALQRAYLAGLEGIPWFSRNTSTPQFLNVEREISESGNLHIPWSVAGHGEFVLATASLMERSRPYHLTVELARGLLNRLRNQAAVWESAGLVLSEPFQQLARQATARFVRAATSQHDPARASKEADEALRLGLDAVGRLCADYAEKVLELRHKQAPRLATLLAGNLGGLPLDDASGAAFLEAFNSAVVPLAWREVELNEGEYDWHTVDRQMEWCRQRQLRVCSGPLLHLDAGNIPDWLYLWEDDFDNLQSYVLQFVEAAVQRYRGRVSLWQGAAGMNCGGELGLTEEQKLRLTVAALETLRRHDARTPLIVTFDQPWAEYLAHQNYDLSPLHFADALVRAELGVAGLGLEINLGYHPGGTLHRDLVEFSRQIDQWSMLGLPLVVILTAPASSEPDNQARCHVDPLLHGGANSPSERSQQAVVEQLVPFLLSKTSVQGIVWNQFSDDEPHKFAHAGLIRGGRKRPALSALAALRSQHLT